MDRMALYKPFPSIDALGRGCAHIRAHKGRGRNSGVRRRRRRVTRQTGADRR